MKSLKNVGIAAVLLVAVGIVNAQAGTITLQGVGGGVLEPFRTPGSSAAQPNDVIPKLWGYLNGNLVLDGVAGRDYLVEFTLVGSESGWTNQLVSPLAGPSTLLSETADFGKAIEYLHTATGAPDDFLKFQFETTAPLSQAAIQPTLVNGSPGVDQIANGGLLGARTFFVSFCFDYPAVSAANQKNLLCNQPINSLSLLTPTTGDVAWIALDDSGAGPNNDHDDWVGYVRVTQVPVPDGGATAGLLGAALLGLGALRQRFSA
jgi:hypothetical protein